MGKVILIGISKDHGSPIANVRSVEAIKGKGLVGEKHFKENNEKRKQITLIEIENINHYNKITGTTWRICRRGVFTSCGRLARAYGRH